MAKSKAKALSAEEITKAIDSHAGAVRFGAYIIARKASNGGIEARFLKPNNVWTPYVPTDAEYIAQQCKDHAIDKSMIVNQ